MDSPKNIETLKSVTIRFSGDSGDGMQLTGSQFTSTTAIFGNDLATFPDFPAEIRAPAGTVSGVSGFQLNFASEDIHTPGDTPDVLIAMNPAALKANIADLIYGGIIIINEDSFTDKDLEKAGYTENPIDNDSLKEKFRIFSIPITKLTNLTLKDMDLSAKDIDRTKNMFALGVTYWLFTRSTEPTEKWIKSKFKGNQKIIDANIRVLKAGYNYAITSELFNFQYIVPKATKEPGTYRNINGNTAMAIGLVMASKKANLPLFLGSYPITPASDILHELSKYKNYGVITFQAEDEIAAISSVIGSAFAGGLAVTTTSGPGMCLKAEAMNLAIMTELPLIIIDVQRGGPSTGLPTKTEQSDLLMAMYGRNGDSPIPILSASHPSDCFETVVEAARIALEFMTPVIVLSDGYIANGSEPWKLTEVEKIPEIKTNKITTNPGNGKFSSYTRNESTLGRVWAVPGTPGLEHRIGGIEKDYDKGSISYDPDNHQKMTFTRQNKIAGISNYIPEQSVYGEDKGKLLVLGWGSTFGAIRSAVESLRENGNKVSHAHLRYINPFPKNLEHILSQFDQILVPELNTGQLAFLIQGEFGIKVTKFNKIKGRPFTIQEIYSKIEELL